VTALYNLWLARNNAKDEEMIEHPDKTAARVLALHDEWQALKEVKAPKPTMATHWCLPVVGWHKANADGAYSSLEGNGGGGVIVRDHHGSPMVGSSVFFPIVVDLERGELLACRRAVELVSAAGVSKLVLETDCAGAVAKLKSSMRFGYSYSWGTRFSTYDLSSICIIIVLALTLTIQDAYDGDNESSKPVSNIIFEGL
jgi:hypothetical protein